MTCSLSARTATRGSSRWSSGARRSTCSGTLPVRCSSRGRSERGRRAGTVAGFRRRPFLPAEPDDAGLERADAALDPAHLLLERRQRRHALDRAADRLVDDLLQLAEPVGDLRELLHATSGALGRGADRLHAAVDRRGEPLERGLAVLDDLAQHAEREEPALPALLLQDDLGERDGGQVLAGIVLEDLHVL